MSVEGLQDEEREPGFYTYTNPNTGTVHVLRSNPRQKTLEYPEETHFHAVGFCGQGKFHMEMEDLTAHYTPIARTADLCGSCERVIPDLYVQTDDEDDG